MKEQDEKEDRARTAEPARIVVSRNGPYLVTGGVPLATGIIANDDKGYSHHWRKGPAYPMRESYALCRCGKSVSKPFCDGYHEKTGFDGTEAASRAPYLEKAEKIEGPGLTLTDYADLCASAKFCERAGGIWNLTRQSDNPGSRKIAITEAGNCPSGRLVVWNWNAGGPGDAPTRPGPEGPVDPATAGDPGEAIEPELGRSISLIEYSATGMQGPVFVRGGIPVISADWQPYEVRNRQTLCRCGRSENKPFCDSSHLEVPGEPGAE